MQIRKELVSHPFSSVAVESHSSLRCLLLLKGDTDEAIYFIHMQMTKGTVWFQSDSIVINEPP